MLKTFIKFTVRFRVATIMVVCFLTLFFAYQILNPWMAGRCLMSLLTDDTACWWSWKLKMVVDPKTILPQDHPYVKLNDRIEKTFGGSRVVVIGIEPKKGDIFNPQTLSTIQEITEGVKKIPGIKEENVVSISDRKVKHVESSGQVIKVQRLMEAIPQTKEDIETFRERVFSNKLYAGGLVSRDGKAAAIITDFREWVPSEQSVVSDQQSGGGSQGNPWWKGDKADTMQAAVNPEQSQPTSNTTNPWWQGDQSGGDWPPGGSQSSASGGSGGYGGFRMSDSAIYEAIQKATSSVQSVSGELENNFYIGGLPVALAFMEKDSARIVYLFPLALLIMMFILYWAFRSFQGMLLPLLTALLSVVWALGMMGLTGIPMDPFNTLTPILILAVAAGHSIQILKRYYEELAVIKDNRAAVIEATSKIAPVTITAALVAAASFGSLVTFQLKTFQAFGLFTAFGILSALALELTFIPALRSILRPLRDVIASPGFQGEAIPWFPLRLLRHFVPRNDRQGNRVRLEAESSRLKVQSEDRESRITILDSFLLAIGRWSTGGRPVVIGGVASVILIVAMIGAFQVRVDNSLKSQFFENTRLRIDEKALNQHFGGTSTFYILIEGDQPNALKDPEVLNAIDGLQRRLEGVPGVGKTESYVDYVKKMNQTFHGGDSKYDGVPEDRQQVADFLFLYAISGNPADFARLVDYDYRQAVIWSYLKSDSTALAEDLIRRVDDYTRDHSTLFGNGQPPASSGQQVAGGPQRSAFGSEQSSARSQKEGVTHEEFQKASQENTQHPTRLTIGVAGSAPVTVALNRTMVEGKIKNVLQIAAIIFVASALVLRSWFGGLLVLLPLALAVLINFGVMGFTGITLGIGTAAISAMAVGIGADYAIYLLFRIREEYKKAQSSNLPAARLPDGQGQVGLEAQSDERGEFELDPLSAAVHKALMTSGRAIIFVAISISAGYAILPFSGYYLHMEGILVPLAMITSCIGALVLLPTLVYALRPRFIVRGV